MRTLLFILFLITSFSCFGQNKLSFDKVIFSYSTGHSSWGDTGVYSRGELFEISRVNSESYKIKKYRKITYSVRGSDGKYLKDTTIVKRIDKPTISAQQIDSLYTRLTTTKPNFTLEVIRPWLTPPSENEILRTATDDSLSYKFDGVSADDRKNNIQKIENFDKLDSFINENKPDTSIARVTADVWNMVKISFIKNSDTTVFIQDYIHSLGQPILKSKINKRAESKQFVNLGVNTLLEEILPKTSIFRKGASISNFTEAYLSWYIKEKINPF